MWSTCGCNTGMCLTVYVLHYMQESEACRLLLAFDLPTKSHSKSNSGKVWISPENSLQHYGYITCKRLSQQIWQSFSMSILPVPLKCCRCHLLLAWIRSKRSCTFPLWSILWLSVCFLSFCCIISSVCPHSKISLTKLPFYEVSGLCVGECSLDCVIWEEALPTLTQQSDAMVFVSIRMSSAFRSLINASSRVQFDSFCFFSFFLLINILITLGLLVQVWSLHTIQVEQNTSILIMKYICTF